MTDAGGRVVWAARYRAWGNVLEVAQRDSPEVVSPDEIGEVQPVRFQGQYYDNESGLHYNRFRYYDPDIGRFVSVDPIGLLGGANTFTYVWNPVTWIDPFGLSPCRAGQGTPSEKGATRTDTLPRQPNTTRSGVTRTNAADWRALRDHWDSIGYGEILSGDNLSAIAKGRTPKVDEAWVMFFPEDVGLMGEKISMHHIASTPVTIPLPATRHLNAHLPGGFRYNVGGPGSALPFYPPKLTEP
jgi:RHS repeat-associated protein